MSREAAYVQLEFEREYLLYTPQFGKSVMERNALFFRALYLMVCCVVTATYQLSVSTGDIMTSLLQGLVLGALIFAAIFALEMSFTKLSLRTFNTALVGIALGLCLALVVTASLNTLFSLLDIKQHTFVHHIILLGSFLASLYFGIAATLSYAEHWWLSLPFVRLLPTTEANKKELLLDLSALEDSRLTDLVRTNILDRQLVLPSFILKEIQKGIESLDETTRTRFRKALEQVKRLENIPSLGLVHKEFHFSDNEDIYTKLLRAARLMHAYILTSEQSSLKQGEEEGVIIISLESIANAIKPSAQRGEVLTIKIQRPGKEPKQGVGYLEDGTMVVVNGGGEYLGKTIRTQVLSQKYSTSGKIIFCNALQAGEEGQKISDDANLGNSYFYSERKDEQLVQQLQRLKKEPGYEKAVPERPVPERATHYDSWNRH